LPQQLDIWGKTKTEQAIRFIQKHEPEEGYFVGDSGGKDSTVLLDLVKQSGVKFQAYYSATGIDPPEVCQFLRKFHPETIWLRPFLVRPKKFPAWKGTHSFFGMLQVNGFPTRTSRWCCNDLKENPAIRTGGKHWLLGIRAEESTNRAKRGQITPLKNRVLYKPIFSWKTWEIWDYIEQQNLPYCSLYDEGFERIGCVVCPFLCHGMRGNLLRHKERWPKQYAAFEKAMKKLFDNYLCVINPRSGAMNYRRETDFSEFLANWYRGK